LFAEDAVLDSMQVSDLVCGYFRDLGSYDYRPAYEAVAGDGGSLIDVDILGHIFEQSITDLEKLRNELDGLAEPLGRETQDPPQKGRCLLHAFVHYPLHRRTGAGGRVARPIRAVAAAQPARRQGGGEDGARQPGVYELDKLTKPAKAALVKFWEAWQDELTTIRLLDPACGSGAFLIQAFDQLHATYQRSNDRLAELRGQRTLFDLDKRILENNLYAWTSTRKRLRSPLSLWIKTAQRGKALTSLDHPIRVGNSVIADATVHPKGAQLARGVSGSLPPGRIRRGNRQPAVRSPGMAERI